MPFNFTTLSIDRDERLRSYCVTAKCTYRDYVALTQGAEENLRIQRSIIRGSKAYATLRADLRRGCVLPPIVLAANAELTRPIESTFQDRNMLSLTADLARLRSESVYVIDGLQRTNAIRQTSADLEGDELASFLARELRVELWINIPFGAIAYRMLLLNAGQRPMSVKHQVEVLSSKLVDDLSGIPGLEIFRVVEARRRTQPGQFPLAKIAQAFQAWLQGQPNLDLRNTVMEELLAESAIEVLGQTVPVGGGRGNADGFHRFVSWLVQLDHALGAQNVGFFGNETVILGISAAVGAMERNETLHRRVWPSLDGLLTAARERGGDDPLGLGTFESLRQGIDASKINVGLATRDMVFSTFKEYIRGNGEIAMAECWRVGAARD
jgi:hypothetical protein